MEPETPSRLTDDQWRYLAWVSVAVGIVAVGAIIAVMVGTITRTPEAARASSEATSTTSTTIDPESAPHALEMIELPVTAPVVIDHPRVGVTGRYHRDGSVVMVRITGDECERSDGMLRAAGTIRNESKVGQTFDYVISLEVQRSLTGSVLTKLETTVENLGPDEKAEWSVEEASSKVTSMRCLVSELTVIPVGESSGR
ncbi:MAG: hypothetical protein ABFR89_02185 [Actinomycetota bacterium]